MSFNEQRLAALEVTTANNTLLYTPPKSSIVLATYMTIVNRGAVAANLSMYHVEESEVSGNGNIIMDTVPFDPNFFHDMTMKISLNTIGERVSQLRVLAGTANVFTLTLYGAVIR